MLCGSTICVAQANNTDNKPEDSKDIRQLEAITVKADLRPQTTVAETATSLTVLDEDSLKQAGNQHFQEVLALVPNLNWSGSTARPRYFQIRGIGERSQYEGAPNPSVGFIIDDMDFTGIGGVATLFDMAQFEVLRGPQGTRYGANALAGLIYARSNEPSMESGYQVSSLLGDDGNRALGFRATGAVAENAAYRFAVHQSNSNGFRYNDFHKRDDSNRTDELVARAKLHWQINNNWQMDLTTLLADIDNGFDVWAPENGLTTHTDDLGWDKQRSTGLSLRNHFALSGFDLISISAYTDSDISYFFDGDWGNDDYWGSNAPYDFTALNNRQRKHLTQEIRLVSDEKSRIFGGSTDWIVGLYFAKLSEENLFHDFYNGSVYRLLNSDYEAKNMAVFSQLDFNLSAKTVLTGGLRYERRQADYRDSKHLNLSPSDNMWGGQLSLNHQLKPNLNLYTLLARGYKAGGFNLSASLDERFRSYDPEFLWNLETGIKSWLFDHRMSLNVSLFYAKREDMQISTSQQADPSDPLAFVYFTDNAAKGKNYGIEADWNYQFNRNWSLHGALGLLKTEFSDYQTGQQTTLIGREQAHAPRYNYNIGVLYQADNGWFARFDSNGSDGFYFSNSHNHKSKAYQLLHAKIGYQADSWAVYLWGRNLLDEKFSVRGFYFALEPPAWENKLYTHQGEPRHIGISAEFNF